MQGPSPFGQITGALGAIGSIYAMSDIALKNNINYIGKSPSGINIYTFTYKGDDKVYQGVMAHEVPHASSFNDDGYLMVDYSKVDVEFKRVN
jgi:hypothetical protein